MSLRKTPVWLMVLSGASLIFGAGAAGAQPTAALQLSAQELGRASIRHVAPLDAGGSRAGQRIRQLMRVLNQVRGELDRDLDRAEALCLAMNDYREARGESPEGRMAVASVTLLRAKIRGGVCQAVYQPGQYEWVDIAHRLGPANNMPSWEISAEIASLSMAGAFTVDYSRGATHYYAHGTVTPWWAVKPEMRVVAVIGGHTFMREERLALLASR